MKRRVFFLIVLIFTAFSVCVYGMPLNENTFLPDGMGNVYTIKKSGKVTEVFRTSPSGTVKSFASGDEFDKVFCIGGEIYLTANKQRFIYILTKSGAEIAEVSLEDDYTMTADENYWYFKDHSKTVKCDIRTGEYEDTEEFPEISEISEDIYSLDGNKIIRLDNGEVTAEYISDMDISEIITSGDNLYAVVNQEVVYIPKSAFKAVKIEESKMEVLQKSEPSRSEISKTEISKIESKIEISVSERSKVPQVSAREPKIYDYTVSSSIYEISEEVIYIPQGTTVAEFKKGMNYGDCTVKFTNHNGKSVTSGQMGTGWRIDFTGGGSGKSYYTVVIGDVTGEGNINSRDIYLMRDYLFGKAEFTKYQAIAADVKKNNVIDSVDMYMIKKFSSQ